MEKTAGPNGPGGGGWLEMAIPIHPVAQEALSNYLFDLKCQGVVTDESDGLVLKAYFPLPQDTQDLRMRILGFTRELSIIFPEVKTPQVRFRTLEDEDWSQSWRRFFREDRVTPRLVIVPAWEPIPREREMILIRMDPGPAFGTGQHPTTRLCLRAMEEIGHKGPWTMMDVGTGSGILAVCAAKLGAERVAAVDTDAEAIRWAAWNIALNDLTAAIELSTKSLEAWREKFSLVVANLLLDELQKLSPRFKGLIETGGRLIVSGILEEQVEVILPILQTQGFYLERSRSMGGWSCLILRLEISSGNF